VGRLPVGEELNPQGSVQRPAEQPVALHSQAAEQGQVCLPALPVPSDQYSRRSRIPSTTPTKSTFVSSPGWSASGVAGAAGGGVPPEPPDSPGSRGWIVCCRNNFIIVVLLHFGQFVHQDLDLPLESSRFDVWNMLEQFQTRAFPTRVFSLDDRLDREVLASPAITFAISKLRIDKLREF
jgi:hypothetical protein